MSTSARKAATGLVVLAAASLLLLLALPATTARPLTSETPGHRVTSGASMAQTSLSGAQARRLKQEDATQGQLVTGRSAATNFCISLNSGAPGPIELQPHEWIVSRQAQSRQLACCWLSHAALGPPPCPHAPRPAPTHPAPALP